LTDVYRGDLQEYPPGSVRRLRIVGVPPKLDPRMNYPSLGVTNDDPGKFVLGTVPVEEDGSAYFRVPAGVPFFVQALNEEGMALQTMRSLTYVQPGQTLACIGCHEHRQSAPPAVAPRAAFREPSLIEFGPEGTWPLDYRTLVQPVLDRHCVECHRPGGEAPETDLMPEQSYASLMAYGGEQSLTKHVLARYDARRSVAGHCAAMVSPLTALLTKDHYGVQLTAEDFERLFTWMDTYGQRSGSHSPRQEEELRQLRERLSGLLTKAENH